MNSSLVKSTHKVRMHSHRYREITEGNTWSKCYLFQTENLIWLALEINFVSNTRSLFRIPLYIWLQMAPPLRTAALGCCVEVGTDAAALLAWSCHWPQFPFFSDQDGQLEGKSHLHCILKARLEVTLLNNLYRWTAVFYSNWKQQEEIKFLHFKSCNRNIWISRRYSTASHGGQFWNFSHCFYSILFVLPQWSVTIGHALCMSSFQELLSIVPLTSEQAGTGRWGFQMCSVLVAPSEPDRRTSCKLRTGDFKFQSSIFKCNKH